MLDEIRAHALDDHPVEACGVVAVMDGKATRLFRMTNAERSTRLHRFDSREQLRVWRSMDDAEEVPLAIYHSHTRTAAWPSVRDINLASLPDMHYLIVSTGFEHEGIRAFRIVEGLVTEEELVPE